MLNIIPITNLLIPELSMYTSTTELQLMRYYEPSTGLFLVESPNVIQRALEAGYKPVSFLVEKKYVSEELSPIFSMNISCPIFTADLSVLCNITGFSMTRGMLAIMKRNPLPSLSEISRDSKRVVVLERVMNPTNIGAIFRSAAALNMDAVLLTKGCSDPLYKRSSRVSMGSVFQIPWTFLPDSYLMDLKNHGYKLISMALNNHSIAMNELSLSSNDKIAIFMGTESDGLSDSTISASDYIVKIPMSHGVDSLNVAAASAIAFWELGQPLK